MSEGRYVGEIPPAPPCVPRGRIWLKRLTVALLVLLLVVASWYGLESYRAERELQAVLAQTDQLDPGWRWDELQAARARIPPGQNSADQLLAARGLLPAAWPPVPTLAGRSAPPPESLDQYLDRVPLNALLPNIFAAALSKELDRVVPSVDVARCLRDLPQGRHPVTLAPDFVSTRMDTIQETRMIATLLRLDAARWAQEGSLDHALESCRAGINCGRSLHDEPFVIALLVRCACTRQAVLALERTLAQGDAPADGLRAVQEHLELEERSLPAALLSALRGERAGGQVACQSLRDGHLSLAVLAEAHDDAWGEILFRAHPGLLKRNHACCLELFNEVIALARLPVAEQQAALTAFDNRVKRLRVDHQFTSMVASLLVAPLPKAMTAVQRSQASLRCAAVALAAERFRQDRGRWPATLAELQPDYLREAIDPFDGQPLRLKTCDEGLIVYSVGVDGTDDGGVLQSGGQPTKGIDLGFRLWDVQQRRQPAR